MKSTWRHDKSKWGFWEWHYELLGLHQSDPAKPAPVHRKGDKVPILPEWQMHRLILFHASIPLVLHQLYASFYGNLSPVAAVLFYTQSFLFIGIHQFHILRRAGQEYGYLDGDKHARDEVPDAGIHSVAISLVATVFFRMVLAATLSYDRTRTPAQLDWPMLVVEVGLYMIVLDFWFYWYHRAMHANDYLWGFHRTHHLTKHPNALLTLYADDVQECLDIVGIPMLAWLSLRAVGLPMGFYEWWICHQYVTFSELTGHSGLRVHAVTPAPPPFNLLLRCADAELVIEDHDLHHRSGWKESHAYGKQTRLWDRVFGTCVERIESKSANIDYDNPATLPLL